jgi:hypothetical protein
LQPRGASVRCEDDADKPTTITGFTPKLLLGDGVEMQAEWHADIDAGRSSLSQTLRGAAPKRSRVATHDLTS